MLRYSLGTLLVAVLFVAVACAALVHPTPLWSQTIFTATVVLEADVAGNPSATSVPTSCRINVDLPAPVVPMTRIVR